MTEDSDTRLVEIDRQAEQQDRERQKKRAKLAAKTTQKRQQRLADSKQRKVEQKKLEAQPARKWFDALGGKELAQCFELRRTTERQLRGLLAWFYQEELDSAHADSTIGEAMRRRLLEHWDGKKYGTFRSLTRLRKLYWIQYLPEVFPQRLTLKPKPAQHPMQELMMATAPSAKPNTALAKFLRRSNRNVHQYLAQFMTWTTAQQRETFQQLADENRRARRQRAAAKKAKVTLSLDAAPSRKRRRVEARDAQSDAEEQSEEHEDPSYLPARSDTESESDQEDSNASSDEELDPEDSE